MLFSRICREFIEPPSFCSIYIQCIANTFFPSTQTHCEPMRIFCRSLFQQSVLEQRKAAHVCSWKTSLLRDNLPEHFPFSSCPTGPIALGQRAWTAYRDSQNPKGGWRKMPPARALEKRGKERPLRVSSGKQPQISGSGEDPGGAHHDRDPAWTVASERKNTRDCRETPEKP